MLDEIKLQHDEGPLAIDGKTSGWLTVLPPASYHFDLAAAQFRDCLTIHYTCSPTDLPSKCDGLGATL